MEKQTIAVDIDDVLSDNAKGFIEFSNQRWGTNLTIDDYTEHWAQMWHVDEAEVLSRSDEFHDSDAMARFAHRPEAEPVLRDLCREYNLVNTTSRKSIMAGITREWIEVAYGGLFSAIHHAGFYDNDALGLHLTKADLCLKVGASYLIDDQLKHCGAAARVGIKAVLFGDYAWNRTDDLPPGITRAHDWPEVQEYFDGERNRR